MLAGAVNKHAKGAPPRDPRSLDTMRADWRSPQANNTGIARQAGHRSPSLAQATSSAFNTIHGSRSFMPVAGVKRTAAEAHAVQSSFSRMNSFQGSRPVAVLDDDHPDGGISKLHEAVYFDENDFDDDVNLDLDYEAPVVKRPQHLSQSTASDLPRKPAIETCTNGTHGQPGSSIPTWSSSPLTHKEPPPNAALLRRPTIHLTDETAPIHPPAPQDTNPRPKQKREIPWPKRAQQVQLVASVVPMQTPKVEPGVSKKDPWDITASAAKAEQKKIKQANKKLVRTNEATEEGLRDAIKSKKRKSVVPLFLSDEQKHILNLVVEKRKSVFFTGSAGTGKSVLLREIISQLRKKFLRETDRVAVTASTGLAACNIEGSTLHSFGGIGLGKEPVDQLVRRIRKNPKARTRWMTTKVLIIDEISMVDGDLFDKLEGIARSIRKSYAPFGGIQVVITGDFFQLPPVPDSGKLAKFAFEAATWTTSIDHTIGLTQVFRQRDPVFADMLNEMRLGKLSAESIKIFQGLSRPIRYEDHLEATELFPTRQEVERANLTRMNNLGGNSMVFQAVDGGTIKDDAQRTKLLSNCMAPLSLTLKKGAQVMLIKNFDDTLVNGSLGIVEGFMDQKTYDHLQDREEGFPAGDGEDGDSIKKQGAMIGQAVEPVPSTSRSVPFVKFTTADGSTRELMCQPETWKIELPNGEVQASRTQIPLILAWALSIHKAQGQTMERVRVDLGKVFEKGQAYVALSRATCQEGLQVQRFDPKKVQAHPKVKAFYESLSSADQAMKPRSGAVKEAAIAPPAGRAQQRQLGDDFDDDAEEAMAGYG